MKRHIILAAAFFVFAATAMTSCSKEKINDLVNKGTFDDKGGRTTGQSSSSSSSSDDHSSSGGGCGNHSGTGSNSGSGSSNNGY